MQCWNQHGALDLPPATDVKSHFEQYSLHDLCPICVSTAHAVKEQSKEGRIVFHDLRLRHYPSCHACRSARGTRSLSSQTTGARRWRTPRKHPRVGRPQSRPSARPDPTAAAAEGLVPLLAGRFGAPTQHQQHCRVMLHGCWPEGLPAAAAVAGRLS